jgi:hypothetical protein
MFTCECGREFAKNFALTNHQKRCDVIHPEISPPERPKAGNGDRPPETMTTTDRNAFNRLITERATTILKALDDELDGSPEHILDQLRLKKGLLHTVQELNQMIEGINEQIKAEIQNSLKSEDQKIENDLADVDDDFEAREREMKERHKREYKALLAEKNQKKTELRQKKKHLEQEIEKQKCGVLLEQKEDLQRKRVYAKQQELVLKAESKQQQAMISQNKGRLKHIINDAKNRALEKLWTTNSREEAEELIHQIPTVQEALELMQAQGVGALLQRINPSLVLPAPDMKDIPPEIEPEEKEEEEEEEEFDEEEVEEEYDEEVYGERRRRRWR